ncbi:MAG: DUF3794 domain-containing protein [Peptostreptococcaceae bacterium]
MELIKDIIKIDNRIEFPKVQTLIESDIVVPDKKADVYKVIKSEGYIAIKNIEVTDEKLILRGSFNYNIIYMTNDKDTVSNIDGKIDINEVIEKDNVVSDMECMLFAEVEYIDCTISNERKIKLTTLMNVKGSLFEKQKIDIIKDITQIEDVQKHRKEIKYLDIIGIEKGESTVKDTININAEEIQDIISLNPSVKIKDSRVSDNKVIISGVVEINPLAVTYDLEVVELDKVGIDFSQFVELPGAYENMKEEVIMSFGDFNYNFKKNEGSTGHLEIDCVVCCKAKVVDETTREVLQDAYSPNKKLKFEHKNLEINNLLSSEEEVFSIRETLKNNNSAIQMKDIVSVCANMSIENNYIENEKSIIKGILKLDILYTPVEGLEPVYKINEEILFENDVLIPGLDEDCKVFDTIVIEKLDVDLSRDEIDLNMRVRRYTEVINKKVEKFIIKGEDLGKYDNSQAPSLIVYICKANDTLWDIAKKYNTTEEEIAELNNLKVEDNLVFGKCLILEKKVVLFD